MEARFDPSAKLAAWCPPFCSGPFLRRCTPLSKLGLDVMSESHCTNRTGGMLIRLKQNKKTTWDF